MWLDAGSAKARGADRQVDPCLGDRQPRADRRQLLGMATRGQAFYGDAIALRIGRALERERTGLFQPAAGY
jgi:hypothetical protein